MGGDAMLLAAAIAGSSAAIVWYWRSHRADLVPMPFYRSHVQTIALLIMGFAFCVCTVILDRPIYSFVAGESPLAIAVAFDLSPSMLAIPDPASRGDVAPRYERAKSTLLELFRSLEERRANVFVSLLGFTRESETLAGWDDNAAQFRDVLEHSLAPDLFSSPGTNIESAVAQLVNNFEVLPEGLQQSSRMIAIIVSDGEDTQPSEFLGYALDELSRQSFDLVALQVGLSIANEGVPRYGEVGEFLGFETMGGNLFTTPNTEAMVALASATSLDGIHVRAENPDAAAMILQFISKQGVDGAMPKQALIATLGLFAVVGLLCGRVLL